MEQQTTVLPGTRDRYRDRERDCLGERERERKRVKERDRETFFQQTAVEQREIDIEI